MNTRFIDPEDMFLMLMAAAACWGFGVVLALIFLYA